MNAAVSLRFLYFIACAGALAACQSTQGLSPSESGPRVDRVDRNVWFAAAEAGETEILRALLDDGIDPSIERRGLNALHIAARQGDLASVELLVNAGLDVDLGPDEQEAALASAAGHGSPQLLEMMAGREMDPGSVADAANLRSPLNLAVANGHAEVARHLIESGADVNAGGEWYTPLHSAVLTGDADLVAMLLESGARTRKKIRIQDRTRFAGFRYIGPVELARIIERDDLVDLLRRHGARD